MERSTKMAIAVTIVMVSVLIGGYQLVLDQAFKNPCRNQTLVESLSPDRSKKVVIFQRSCGATDGYSTQASLISPDSSLANKSGNLFVADTDHGVAPSGAGGGPELRYHWTAPNHLLIEHHVAARVFKAEHRFKTVEITYASFK